MKTLIYTINILIIILFVSVTGAQAAVTSEIKMERYAVLGAWLLFGVTMLITYLIWRKKSKNILHHTNNKVRIKSYEMMDHGRRVIVTKKLPASKSSTKKVA
jgi:ABC-type transport system involved in cytochrome bd biosynthesis fused ATPase/permease subunit